MMFYAMQIASCNTVNSTAFLQRDSSNAFQNHKSFFWNKVQNNLKLTQWAEVSPFLHNSMKKAKAKKQFLP